MIISIEKLYQDPDNTIHVEAVIEDFIIVNVATYSLPEEYGPAVCKASFELEDGEVLPVDETELIKFINDLQLDWQLLECNLNPFDDILF